MTLQEALAAVAQQKWLDEGLAPHEMAYSPLDRAAFALASEISKLREAAVQAQTVLASLTDAESIRTTTVINAYAQVRAAECSLREVLATHL